MFFEFDIGNPEYCQECTGQMQTRGYGEPGCWHKICQPCWYSWMMTKTVESTCPRCVRLPVEDPKLSIEEAIARHREWVKPILEPGWMSEAEYGDEDESVQEKHLKYSMAVFSEENMKHPDVVAYHHELYAMVSEAAAEAKERVEDLLGQYQADSLDPDKGIGTLVVRAVEVRQALIDRIVTAVWNESLMPTPTMRDDYGAIMMLMQRGVWMVCKYAGIPSAATAETITSGTQSRAECQKAIDEAEAKEAIVYREHPKGSTGYQVDRAREKLVYLVGKGTNLIQKIECDVRERFGPSGNGTAVKKAKLSC